MPFNMKFHTAHYISQYFDEYEVKEYNQIK